MPILSVDSINKLATLEVEVGGVIVTTFSYANGIVTLSARPVAVDISNEEFDTRIAQIKTWISDIEAIIVPVVTTKVKYRIEYKRTNTGLEAKYILTSGINIIVTEAVYNDSTGLTTFSPRVETAMAWTDFVYWVYFLSHIRSEISVW